MSFDISPRLRKRIISAAVIIPVVVACILANGIPFILLVVANAVIVMYEWFNLSLKSRYKYFLLAIGALYVAIAFGACYLIRVDYGIKYALLFVIMIWASDIGGYVFGKIIGGPKMAKTISPNKTWAGLAGAAIFPVIAANIYLHTYSYIYEIPTWEGMAKISIGLFVMGAVIGVVGQAGDLLISLFKQKILITRL